MSITAIPSSTFSQPQFANATKVLQQNFAQIGQDLVSGNLSAAQKDLSTVQEDLQSPGGSSLHHSHHHHRTSTGGFGNPTQNSMLQELNQLGQDPTSGSVAGARQAYATLLQQLQPAALDSGARSTQSAVSLQA